MDPVKCPSLSKAIPHGSAGQESVPEIVADSVAEKRGEQNVGVKQLFSRILKCQEIIEAEQQIADQRKANHGGKDVGWQFEQIALDIL
jgi:hypothetical protein